ncbi:MAG: glycosyltransferase [Zetaproteobacteria bacterium]|nr:MAG: glycosyltransferase [Zetaproteobacteria bacterium]
MPADIRIVIMAKAPRAGYVKTRMCPPLRPKEAARLHERMLRTVLRRAQRLFDEVWLATDVPEHPMFATLTGVRVLMQGGGDLGARLRRMLRFSHGLDARPILFLGADSPHMPDQRLLQAASAMHRYDVVIGPVEDGGYDLIGLGGPYTEVFKRIDWGSDQVYRQTLRRCEEIGLRWHALPMFFDLDTYQDVLRAGNAWSS